MLYVVRKDKDIRTGVAWYVGSRFPRLEWSTVVELTADMDELTAIKDLFPTLPYPSLQVITFPGWLAQYIAVNLFQYVNRT